MARQTARATDRLHGVDRGARGRDHRHLGAMTAPTPSRSPSIRPRATGHRHARPRLSARWRKDGGVLVRAGHTEAAVDVARLAGLYPAGVICEIMNDDGTMARLPDLIAFAQRHGIKIATIADLIAYRLRYDHLVRVVAETAINSAHGGTLAVKVYATTVDPCGARGVGQRRCGQRRPRSGACACLEHSGRCLGRRRPQRDLGAQGDGPRGTRVPRRDRAHPREPARRHLRPVSSRRRGEGGPVSNV